MPKPKAGENRNDFVGRCVPIAMKEGLDQKAAVGKCEGVFSSHKRGGIAKSMKGEK